MVTPPPPRRAGAVHRRRLSAATDRADAVDRAAIALLAAWADPADLGAVCGVSASRTVEFGRPGAAGDPDTAARLGAALGRAAAARSAVCGTTAPPCPPAERSAFPLAYRAQGPAGRGRAGAGNGRDADAGAVAR